LARFMVWKLGIRAQLTFEGKSALFRGRAPRRGARDGRARKAGGSRAAATSTMAASASVAYPRPHASFASASPGVARRNARRAVATASGPCGPLVEVASMIGCASARALVERHAQRGWNRKLGQR